MGRVLEMLRSLAASRPARWVGVPVIGMAAIAALIGQSQTTTPPSVDLAAEPLYARGARAKPTLTLALSVEFPTVGAQYVNVPNTNEDNSYDPARAYIGYFDAESCYTYNKSIGDATQRRFDRSGDAARGAAVAPATVGPSLHTCGGTAFSGNFMNWAGSSAIDVLRFGLTGGDRIVDLASLTVLQRAVLPIGKFWNDNNFPAKRLVSTLVDGAVPTSLKGTHTGDIYVASCLNRIHFGTAKTASNSNGTCDTPGTNTNLGSNFRAAGPVTDYAGTLPLDFAPTPCSVQDGPGCSFAGVRQVAYGAINNWKFMTVQAGVDCNNTVFGNPLPGTTKACYTRPDPTGFDPSPSTDLLSNDPFFYSRVQVCESDGSGNLTDPRTSLCLRYPNGNYKPVGNLQKYSDRVRVAAFGYLNDNTEASGGGGARYGGVLRAPMKYVGPKKFDANFSLVSGANANQEWNESTGIFAVDPDSAAEGRSGVTNYLNQFGRTGTVGQYKTYDPVGELYYEALRYLQGLPPTPAATSGMDAAMKDGYPVYTSWTDPHPAVAGMTNYSCVKNNIVAIGDVNTHSDKHIPGNTRVSRGDTARPANDTTNEPNFVEWTKVVGAFEEKRSITYQNITTSNPNAANSIDPDLETKTPPCCNENAYYMAGMAYWANTHDIRGSAWTGDTTKQRPGMRVTTYVLDVNEYGRQSDVALRRNNQYYLAAKYGGFDDLSGTGNPFLGKDGTANGNLNWERQVGDATDPKREAKNYFLSSSAQEVLDSLDQIFKNIADEANSIAGGAISTQRLTTLGGLIYQAQFDPADWSGDLVAYPVSVGASAVVNIGTVAESPWKNAANVSVGAAGKLDELTAAGLAARKIFVGFHTAAATPVFTTTEFKWTTSLDNVVKNALKTPPGAASAPPYDSDAMGEDRLNYLRGDRSKEAPVGTLRKRGSRLGDIVNSGVAFSGPPQPRFSDTKYASFISTHATRTKALFVGANDGMLHAFNADTGDELFGYIPSWLLPKLPLLTAAPYTHRSYLDGTPVVAEAKVGADTDSQPWKTVLVSGTGGGGQGVFALDVSDPTAFADDKVMWEFSDRDDPEMGNVIGRPQILKVNRNAVGTTPDYRYFAVVASGVNNYKPDGNTLATGDTNYAKPVLFLLDLRKPKAAAWTSTGSDPNYFKVRFPVNSTAIASGLVNFTARVGAADELTYLYAGDLQGNLWKLDFTQQGSSNWNLDALSYFKVSGAAIPMYVAQDAAGNRQPITMDPALVFGPNRTIIVTFGTGKFLEVSDNGGPYRPQSIYAVLDNNSNAVDSTSPTAAISGRGRLMRGVVTASSVSVDPFNWGRPAVDDSPNARSGWYFDFFHADTITSPPADVRPGTGERQISSFGVVAGKLVFGTVIPALNSCDNGNGNLYVVDLRSGDATSTVSTVGILGEPFLAQVGTSSLTGSNTTGRRQETSRYQIILQGSAGLAAPPTMGFNVISHPGRLSWREISNYQELKNGP